MVAHRDGGPNSGWEFGRGEAAAACLRRLDARAGMRADVSGALLQRLAEPRREEVGILSVVASGGDVAGALVYFLGGNFVPAGYAAAPRKRHRAQRVSADTTFAPAGHLLFLLPLPPALIPSPV